MIPPAATRRERIREAARAEIKAAALLALEADGVEAVSFSAIGRAISMTPQGLYRYFDDRDAVLAELAVDGYRNLADALRPAAAIGASAGDRLRGLASAYRRWALDHPRLYQLIFSSPADANEDLAAAAHGAMAAVLDALAGTPERPLRGPRASDLERQLGRWLSQREGSGLTVSRGRAAVAVVSRLHGLVDLELRGQFSSMQIDGELLTDDEIEWLINCP